MEESEKRLRESIGLYLRNNTQLPSWKPGPGRCTQAVRDHINSLQLPMLSKSSPSPSLLLHKLGQPLHDPHMEERIKRLFSTVGSQQKYSFLCQLDHFINLFRYVRFLCNTSGSGKTRLLLEGLWRNWGFYFTARTQPEGVGSSDFQTILKDLETVERLVPITPENRARSLAVNEEIVARRFLRILCARVYIFRLFIDSASQSARTRGVMINEFKGRWLLLQVAPETLIGGDIFFEVGNLLARASLDFLRETISADLGRVNSLFGNRKRVPLFCVLDEAQVPTNKFLGFFSSNTEPAQPRPLIRPIIQYWTSVLPRLVISGTGISMQDLETVLGSAVAKESGSPQPETVTDLGAFDTEEDQREYLEYYLPRDFLDSESGEVLASRVGYWLHGRYVSHRLNLRTGMMTFRRRRFTATFLSRLIQNNFQSPHRVLNDFFQAMTGFRPSDGDYMCNLEPPICTEMQKPRGFEFSRLADGNPNPNRFIHLIVLTYRCIDPELLRDTAGLIFDYVFQGQSRDIVGSARKKLVEYGVARFSDARGVVADEPLALLAAVDYFSRQTAWTFDHFMRDALSSSNPALRGSTFEHFAAFLIALAFKSPTRLSSVFNFISANDLANELAQLVALDWADGKFVCTPVDVFSNSGPAYILAHTACTESETLSWLRDPKRVVFCFPVKSVGPDGFLVLRLLDGRVVRIILQFKQLTSNTIGPKETKDAFESTDPMQFLKEKVRPVESTSKSEGYRIRNSELSGEMQNALRSLGPSTDKAGEFGIIRALVCHPATPNLATIETLAKADLGKHPAATVNLTSLVNNPSHQEILDSLRKRVAATAIRRKQANIRPPAKRQNTPNPSAKRQRRQVKRKG
jgi:hypothetical protein